MKKIVFVTVAAIYWAVSAAAQPARLTDRDIVEAYEYMLARWLVLRQENLDFKEGFKWNQIIHREPGGVDPVIVGDENHGRHGSLCGPRQKKSRSGNLRSASGGIGRGDWI